MRKNILVATDDSGFSPPMTRCGDGSRASSLLLRVAALLVVAAAAVVSAIAWMLALSD